MASFQVKIDWEWPRKRENKRNRSEEFLPYKQQKIKKKKAKKLKKLKIKKNALRLLFKQKLVGKR